jgi:Flp pilus assembly protein TadG
MTPPEQCFLFKGAGASQRRRGEAGQALVEFAMMLPILSCCLFGMIYLCLAFYSYNMITDTAQEAARFASVRGSSCLNASGTSCTASLSDISAYALGFRWPNLAGGKMMVTASFPDTNQTPGSRVLVTVDYKMPNFVPFLPGGAITMSQSSEKIIVQ